VVLRRRLKGLAKRRHPSGGRLLIMKVRRFGFRRFQAGASKWVRFAKTPSYYDLFSPGARNYFPHSARTYRCFSVAFTARRRGLDARAEAGRSR
jgi:hypothetical protein